MLHFYKLEMYLSRFSLAMRNLIYLNNRHIKLVATHLNRRTQPMIQGHFCSVYK